MKRILKISVIVVINSFLLLFFTTSCTHEPNFINDLVPVCFETQILPIMQTSCSISGCHDGHSGESDFIANNYESIIDYVTPGDASKSKLYRVITKLYGENIMPPDRPLSQSQRNLILIWIEQGALNINCNDSPSYPKSDSVCFQQIILPLVSSGCALAGCHDNITHAEGINLTSYASIIGNTDLVRPFQPNESKMYKVLFETGEDIMPPLPYSPFTEQQKEYIRQWITDGALNSDCPSLICDTLGSISYSTQISPILEFACVGCHNSSYQSGGINLSSYANVYTQATTLREGIPVLLGVLERLPGFQAMPPSVASDICTIRSISLWIDQGSLNN